MSLSVSAGQHKAHAAHVLNKGPPSPCPPKPLAFTAVLPAPASAPLGPSCSWPMVDVYYYDSSHCPVPCYCCCRHRFILGATLSASFSSPSSYSYLSLKSLKCRLSPVCFCCLLLPDVVDGDNICFALLCHPARFFALSISSP